MSDNPPPCALSLTEGSAPQTAPINLVLDTNVLLALWLFHDPALEPLRQALASGRVRWRATPAMLEELALVLSRPYPARFRPGPELSSPPAWLSDEPAAPAPWRCRDLADQKFLDLAWALQLPLWSRDRDLLSLRRRGAARGLHIETPEAAQRRLLQD
jgi:predicted nucleic acid-binding protein